MAHINIKPLSRTQIYETAEQAIYHVLSNELWAQAWDWGGLSFGRSFEERNLLNAAIKADNYSAFAAKRRRGYWRVEFIGQQAA
jgi:hypothetical protein